MCSRVGKYPFFYSYVQFEDTYIFRNDRIDGDQCHFEFIRYFRMQISSFNLVIGAFGRRCRLNRYVGGT